MTLKCLQHFLGLTGYYCNFFHHYGKIAKPLTDLLKKNEFHWKTAAEQAFKELKRAMFTTPVLETLDFKNTFLVELDSFGNGIGAILDMVDLCNLLAKH